MRHTARLVLFAVIFLCSTGFDQASKEWARTELVPHEVTPAISIGAASWSWQLEQNPGAAFSTFVRHDSRVATWLFAALALVAIGFAIRAAVRRADRLPVIGYALIAGGALGNALDRARLGSVTDFVRWSVRAHVWPIFNVADAALVVGVGLLVVAIGLSRRGDNRPGNPRTRSNTRAHIAA